MPIPVRRIDSYSRIEKVKDADIIQIVSGETTYNVSAKSIMRFIKEHPEMDEFYVNEVDFSEEVNARIKAEKTLQSNIDAEKTRATNIENLKADYESPTLTGTPKAPTASSDTNTAQIATTAFVQTVVKNGIAASDAMIIKGTIGTSGTVTALPNIYKTGWTYRVVTAGTYAGQVCEIGDLIIALADRDGAGNIDSDWCVAQTNINGAITGIKNGDEHLQVSQSGSVVTITHKDVSRVDTSSAISPSHGGTFTAVKEVTTDAKGHVTGVNTGVIAFPAYGVASDDLGLIKSGTDITVDSSGNVSVNDDSHNHIIGNVDGLQTALDSKSPTSHTHNYAGSSSSGGVANSALKLSTARLINGTLFDGSSNITILANPVTTNLTTQNLNDIIISGLYYGDGGNSVVNKPSTVNAFGLQVLKANSYISQILVESDTSSGKIWQRQYNGTSWSAWTYVFSQLYKPTKKDIGLENVENKSSATIRSELTRKEVETALGYTPGTSSSDTNTTYRLTKSGSTITLTGSDGSVTNVIDDNTTYNLGSFGITATVTELNYSDGVTSNIQTQLNGKSASNHTHNYAGSSSAGGAATSALVCTGNSATATKWSNARNINGLSIDGTADRVNYGTCSTAAATTAKTVACSGFVLLTGAEIAVKFTVTNTASSPTLNVNSTGAKAIYYRGTAISASALAANRTYTFRYNGAQYDLVGDLSSGSSAGSVYSSTEPSGLPTYGEWLKPY